MLLYLKKLILFLKDCIFPVYCLGCGVEGEWLCDECKKSIPVKGIFCCPYCHSYNAEGYCCFDCKKHSYLDKTLAIFPYQNQQVSGKLIEYFKYQYIMDLKSVFKQLITEWLKNRSDIFANSIIIPVPLHVKRYAERGFNQAEEIAVILAGLTGNKMEKILLRNRYTNQQVKLNKLERQLNVQDAFAWSGNSLSQKVILVDDVFTTGSTLQECAKVLKQAGVKEVVGFTLARG